MSNLTLIIARHGNTFSSEEIVRRVGITDLPLVESGIQQAQLLAHHFKAIQRIPDVFFTSELQRTKQMAEIIQRELDISIPAYENALFNEIDYGIDENQPEELVVERIGKIALAQWEEHAVAPPGWYCFPEKTIKGWQHFAQSLTLNHENQCVCVFTSNGIARFAPYLLEGGIEKFLKHHSLKLSTGAYGIFTYDKGSATWHCLCWNQKP
jgi:2,3-bisphosphoglycerate-dependent phosphoglycerate mutase